MTAAATVPDATTLRVGIAAGEDEITQAGALTAEAYHADRLLHDGDEYDTELRDAVRRAREATLLVATVPRGARTGPAGDPAEPADRGDVVVGTITMAPYGTSYAEIAEPGELELRMLAVAPEARRRGVAMELLHCAMREAVAARARGLVLSTQDVMVSAQRLYRRLGFVEVPERDWSHEQVHLRVWVWRPPVPPGVLVEAATWRPVRTADVGGWTVGESGGLTRRANSVLASMAPDDVDGAIAAAERIYAERGLPAVFRVDAGTRPAELDARLAARGYAVAATTYVLVRDLPAGLAQSPSRQRGPDVAITVADAPDRGWVASWLSGRGAVPEEVDAALRILTASPAVYLTARDPGGVVGVVRAALTEDWAGLSCLAVAAQARGLGVGRALTQASMREAVLRGARRAFLQVEQDNTAALRLYASLGFVPADCYRYRERAELPS